MINTVAEALNIRTEDDLRHALLELDHDIEQEISLLTNTLAKNPVSSDVSSIFNHMGFVESWRSRIGRFHMVVSALVAHAKSDEFEIVPAPGIKITEVKREMHIKRLSGGFSAWQVRLENLLDEAECAELIELARPRLARALTVDDDGKQQVDQRRTSEGMFFSIGELPLVARIEQRLAGLLGLPVSHGEGLQILHYRPGQEYEPHFDWFDPALPGYDAITRSGGQRIASVVIYLNTPELGGGTAFPELGLTVTARRGSAVYFAYEGGDPSSLHAGLPVICGEKWIATKWLRERPYRQGGRR